MPAYYNEIDPYAAQWLRNLIAAGHIAPGDVDERSIKDVKADDLRGYQQAHFFAGIGGWSIALRLAGWPDDRPVWTGSCPCQPFSSAGAGKAADDERHLWPAWFSLIAQLRPRNLFGEQVEAAIGWGWLDLVCSNLEGEGYAVGAAVLPACGIGAPHIRQRLWFVAHADGGDAGTEGLQRGREQRQFAENGFAGKRMVNAAINGSGAFNGQSRPSGEPQEPVGGSSLSGELADAVPTGRPKGRAVARNGSTAGCSGVSELAYSEGGGKEQPPAAAREGLSDADRNGPNGGMVNAAGEQEGLPRRSRQSGSAMGDADGERETQAGGFSGGPITERERSPWAEAEWIECRDGKSRPVEPGTFPLATGIPARMGRLRAYGNAIVPQVAAEFIKAATG